MTTLSPTEQQLIALLRAAVSGGSAAVENADWPALFSLAAQQKLLPLLFEQARTLPAAAEHAALFAAVKQQVIAQVLSQSARTEAFFALYRQLRASGMHPVVVKGQLCSRLYSLRDHRISGDDDLLISDDEFAACHAFLLENGLTASLPADELAQADEISYTKSDNPLHLELHRRLFDSSPDAHDDMNRFFANVTPVEQEGLLTLAPHEHLLYLLLHAYKHFIVSGVGLRQLCDIGLWARAYRDAVDWALLHEQCRSVHADVFAEAAFSAARNTLGIAFPLPAPWGSAPDTVPLLHDALCGGVYGSNDLTRLHSSTVTLNAVKASRSGKHSSALASLFPSRRYMQRQYPYVKRSALLLPLAWGQRAAGYLREQRTAADSNAAASLRLGRERIELLRQYGVMD